MKKRLQLILLSIPLMAFATTSEDLMQIHVLTTTEISALSSPAEGSMIYNASTKKINFYNGAGWLPMDGESIYSSDGTLDGNRSMDLNANTFRYLNGEVVFESNTTLQVKGMLLDKDGDTGSAGQVLSMTATGPDWITPANNPVPYISNTLIGTPVSSTVVITLTGMNFTPASTVTIPGFDGTINRTQVVSPTQIDLNITTGAINTFDLIVSNHDVNNTQWANNGVGVLRVTNNNGQTQATAGLSCKKILDDGYSSGDGTYWIDPDGDGDTSDAFEVYCDMSGGGWTKIEYATDLPHQAQFSGGDGWKWLLHDFNLTLTDQQINDIRAISTEGKQHYHGTCEGVIHYEYKNGNFAYAFGFRFHNGEETAHGQQNYPNTNITVSNDNCKKNDNALRSTDFDIVDIRVPVINVHSRDNSHTEKFGSPLTQYPAWLR